MADQGAIGWPNGYVADTYSAIKFDSLWQNTGFDIKTPCTNGVSELSYWAVKFDGLWQNNGMGPYVSNSAIPAVSGVPWEFWFAQTLPLQFTHNRNGYITGNITSQTVPVPYANVTLNNGWGLLLAATRADINGTYRFDGLNKGYSDYTVLVSDPTATFNLGRLDNLTPY